MSNLHSIRSIGGALNFVSELTPELVIFDCDGVLVDSEIISANTLIHLLEPLGIHIDLNHIRNHFIGRSFPKVAALIRSQFKLELPESFEREYRNALLKSFESDLKCTFGINNILQNLSVPYCVATSSSPERAARSLEIAGLDSFFHGDIFTASEVKNGKPAPDLFLHVANKKTVDPAKCLVIEDSLPGIEAAISANMNVIRYTGGSQFDEGYLPDIELQQEVTNFDSWAKFFDIVPKLK